MAMSSVKESLHNAVDLLSNEEARQALEIIQRLRQTGENSSTLKVLASDPTFRVPPKTTSGFRPVQPIQGQGVLASQLLVEDRR